MSTLYLGPYFLQQKVLWTSPTGSTTGNFSSPIIQGFCSHSEFTSSVWNGCNLGTVNNGNTALENNSIYPTIQHLTTTTSPGVSYNKYLAGGPSGATHLMVFSGTKPDISTVTNLSNYQSNLLIDFVIPAYNSSNPSISGMKYTSNCTPSTKPSLNANSQFDGFSMVLGICPTFTAATASGVATWFWFGNYSSPNDLSDIAFTIGSVGVLGSSADLQISDTTILAGDLFLSAGFNFTIPSIYTV